MNLILEMLKPAPADWSHSTKPVQIGWLNVKEHEYCNRSFECAAWSETMHVSTQRVPLRYDGYWLLAAADATIIRDNFPSLYCGVSIGGRYDALQNAGKSTRRTWQMDAYALPAMVTAGEVDLLPRWCISTLRYWICIGNRGCRITMERPRVVQLLPAPRAA